jgi:hypothetical protein
VIPQPRLRGRAARPPRRRCGAVHVRVRHSAADRVRRPNRTSLCGLRPGGSPAASGCRGGGGGEGRGAGGPGAALHAAPTSRAWSRSESRPPSESESPEPRTPRAFLSPVRAAPSPDRLEKAWAEGPNLRGWPSSDMPPPHPSPPIPLLSILSPRPVLWAAPGCVIGQRDRPHDRSRERARDQAT